MARFAAVVLAACSLALTSCAHPTTAVPDATPDCAPNTPVDAEQLAACHPLPAPVAAPPAAPTTRFQPPVDTTDPACGTEQLFITRADGQGGGGHGGEQLVFRNHGPTCQLTGYPTVELLDASGRVVEHVEDSRAGYLGGYGAPTTTPLPQVRLTTGATASAILEGIHGRIDGDPRPCPSYVAYRITAPGQHTSTHVIARDGVCYPTVHPIVPGTDTVYPPQK
jgi:hypothetical protein